MNLADFPEAREIRRLLEGLLGRDVSVAGDGPDTVVHQATTCGLVDDDGRLRFVLGTDLALAHLLGASVALIPAGRAKDAAEPDEDLLANYAEVANVLSRSLNERSDRRVRIDPGLAFDRAGLAEVVAGAARTVRYAVEVAGYGRGVLVIAGAAGAEVSRAA
jgi:hypothetical protein